MLRTVTATRYVTPLREGGSLPAVVEADDDGLYVVKFRGAGQGPRALVAELVAGEIARRLGLRVPELVLVELDPLIARSEPDPEIQALLQASAGRNLGLDFLPGALAFDPAVDRPPPELASSILWFDALVENVDRTARNTNMLMWHQRLWLIDHGAALIFHHDWRGTLSRAPRGFVHARDHVLLPAAPALQEVDASLAARLNDDELRRILALVPDSWLPEEPHFATREAQRAAYVTHLARRLTSPRRFVQEARDAHANLV